MFRMRGLKALVPRLATGLQRTLSTSTVPPVSKPSLLGKVVKYTFSAIGITAVGTSLYIYADEGLKRSAVAFIEGGKIYYQYESIEIANMTAEEATAAKEALHKKMAPIALETTLELGGYYVKLAQTMVGGGFLPKTYEDVFSVLLDDCPPKSFDVVRETVESELGCSLAEAYASFDATPIGAASIGQVHRARLHTKEGEDPANPALNVVVKVQYPEVEKFFKMDFDTMKAMCKWAGYEQDIRYGPSTSFFY